MTPTIKPGSSRLLLGCSGQHRYFSRSIVKYGNNAAKLDDREAIWKVAPNAQERYWKGYLSTRPKYGTDFYRLIYDYHTSHSASPSFAVAHDVGAGPGQVSRELASRFSHVVVSDNNKDAIDYARQALSSVSIPTMKTTKGTTSSQNNSEQFSYIVSPGEDLWRKVPAASADLIVCPLMFPLMDTAAAMDCFRTLLKPNGTLAIWFYGRAHFAEPEYAEKCQPLLDRIINHHFSGIVQSSSDQWKYTADRIASWLDYIPFDGRDWYAVERRKWNEAWTEMGFFGQQACNFAIEPACSNIREEDNEEVVIGLEDRNLWRKSWNVSEVRRFVEFIFPFPFKLNEKPVEALWSDLAREMGGSETRRAFSWPAALILAAKK